MKNYYFPQIYAKNKYRILYEEISSLFSFLEFSELFFRIISNLLTKRLELAIVGKIQILLIGLIYKEIQGPRNNFFLGGLVQIREILLKKFALFVPNSRRGLTLSNPRPLKIY